MLELVNGGSVINGAYPVYFKRKKLEGSTLLEGHCDFKLNWPRAVQPVEWLYVLSSNLPRFIGYYSFALSTFAPVKYGTFARKMTHLPRDFWHICSKNGPFALVKKGTFAQKNKTIMYICIKLDSLWFIMYKFVHDTL